MTAPDEITTPLGYLIAGLVAAVLWAIWAVMKYRDEARQERVMNAIDAIRDGKSVRVPGVVTTTRTPEGNLWIELGENTMPADRERIVCAWLDGIQLDHEKAA